MIERLAAYPSPVLQSLPFYGRGLPESLRVAHLSVGEYTAPFGQSQGACWISSVVNSARALIGSCCKRRCCRRLRKRLRRRLIRVAAVASGSAPVAPASDPSRLCTVRPSSATEPPPVPRLPDTIGAVLGFPIDRCSTRPFSVPGMPSCSILVRLGGHWLSGRSFQLRHPLRECGVGLGELTDDHVAAMYLVGPQPQLLLHDSDHFVFGLK